MLDLIGRIIVYALAFFTFVCAVSLFMTVLDYKKTTDKREKAQLKAEIKTIAIVLSCLIIVLTGSIMWLISYVRAEKAYEYKAVTTSVETVETLYEVHIDRVISEKDKESVYYITLSNNKMVGTVPDGLFFARDENHPLYKMTGKIYLISDKIIGFLNTPEGKKTFNGDGIRQFDEIKLELSESEYESIIGSGNNHLRMDVHILTLSTEEFHEKQHNVILYRLGCFEEVFSEKEVESFSEQFLEAANNRNCNEKFSDEVLVDFVVVH